MDGQSTNLSGLSATLHTQFVEWLERRKPQEDEFLRVYEDNMRIQRDDDTKQTGMSRAQKSKIFIGSTRGKIRSARAKIKDSLFGSGELPFDTKPTNEKLTDFSDTMEEILRYQLEEGKYRNVLGTGVDGLATYGTGFIFGPFVKTKTHETVKSVTGAGGLPELKSNSYQYDCPYFEHAQVMDCYPDPEAEDVHAGRGIYWASRKSPDFIRALKGADGYDDDAIDMALTERVTAYTDQGSDRTEAARMNIYRYTEQGRIWFNRYFGTCKKSELKYWKTKVGSPSQADDKERVEVVVIMAGGYVIKAEENPYKGQKRPVYRCAYEEVEHEMWGVGVGKNNEPHQRVINAAFRLFIEAKAYSLMPIFSVDRSKFELTEDFKMFPGKRLAFKPGLTPEERKDAIIFHPMPDVSTGWESLIAMSEQFSDDDTAITKYTQGDDSRHLNDTATGISMIMNASSLPTKEVISHIDENWIEDNLEALMDWDFEHLEPETVKVLLGDKQAEQWAQIKAYGKTNFMEWFATGSATFMAKEVLMHKLQGFMQIVAGNEALAQHVDLTELLNQVWDAGQIGKESPVLSEEDMQKKQSNPANQQAMQHIQEIEQQATELIKKAQGEAQAARQQATESKRQEAYKMRELDAKSHKENMELLLKFTQDGAKSHLTAAQIDLLQAQTVKTDKEALIVPSPEMVAAAAEKEKADDTGGTAGADSAVAAGSDSGVADAEPVA